MLSLPIVPPDIRRSLEGSLKYYRKHGDCVHCGILKFELQNGRRIIYEDDGVVALAPFASRAPYEVRIFPRQHQSRFEESTDNVLFCAADALVKVLGAIKERLGDPDYNFFLHTSPFHGKQEYSHYHWHMEVIPKLSLFGGFEWSTGIDINSVDPDEAAQLLKSAIK
jgi:UDPglucose--hexose-1-phosphate uridylyltransferase